MKAPSFSIEAAAIERDWRVLCRRIGERRAGTEGERTAADFIEASLRETGLSKLAQERFPCTSLRSDSVTVQVRRGDRWDSVESRCLVGAPATGGILQGPMAWLEMPEAAGRLGPGSLRGKIAMLFGPLPTSIDHHRKLCAARPLAVIHVDERLPFAWAKNDGVYPAWARKYGVPPTVTVAYREAWAWRRDGLEEVRVSVELEQVRSKSQNVVGELPGADPKAPVILLGAHYDTQAHNVGADDNASGVVCLLELARQLARVPLRRPVRFVFFGTEEQLSVGSAEYVRRHRRELKGVGMVLNFDSVSSPLGHWILNRTGPEKMGRFAAQFLRRRGLDPVLQDEVIPFSDHFPFSVYGVPTLWFFRPNFPGGRWQHHSAHDSLKNVSVDVVAELLTAVAPLVHALSWSDAARLGRGLPASQGPLTRKFARELFDLER